MADGLLCTECGGSGVGSGSEGISNRSGCSCGWMGEGEGQDNEDIENRLYGDGEPAGRLGGAETGRRGRNDLLCNNDGQLGGLGATETGYKGDGIESALCTNDKGGGNGEGGGRTPSPGSKKD